AAYVSYESVQRLAEGAHPEPSVIGIVMNLTALVVMVPLARMKRRTGEALGNDVLLADAAETRLSNYLSLNVLAGLSLNALVGWWWADPAAALVIAAYAAWTGWKTWRESGEDERRVVAEGPR
ncbi:MAG: cation transporter, partial [Thermoanaerobaculia bacterium]